MEAKQTSSTFKDVRDTIESESIKVQFDKKLQQLEKEISDGDKDWNLSVEKSGTRLFLKNDPVWIILKSDTETDIPMNTLVSYLSNINFRMKYDNLIESLEKIKDVSDNVQIYRSQIKGKYLIISPRDFITYRVSGYLDENVSSYK